MMNPKRQKKLILILCSIAILGIAASLTLYALKQNINLFYTPSELMTAEIKPDQIIRLGGYVKKGSVSYDNSGQKVEFIVTDRSQEMKVAYAGVLPNLFKEGQTVVVSGHVDAIKHLTAKEVLAKHDENYVPKNLASKLKKGEAYGA